MSAVGATLFGTWFALMGFLFGFRLWDRLPYQVIAIPFLVLFATTWIASIRDGWKDPNNSN
jgi:uncharacterized protein YqgC (DUF456 family)